MIKEPTLIYDDYMNGLSKIDDHSVQLIVASHTDLVDKELIDLDKLFEEYRRILKQNGTILIVGKEPWLSKVRLSNEDLYRYDWSWNMPNCITKPMSKIEPVDSHRNIAVFSYENSYYSPLFLHKKNFLNHPIMERNNCLYHEYQPQHLIYPRSVINFHEHFFSEDVDPRIDNPHIEYLQYLILTYTKPHDIVLDNFMGTGNCCVAALKQDRRFIGIESETELYEKALDKIDYAKKYLDDYFRHHHHQHHFFNHPKDPRYRF